MTDEELSEILALLQQAAFILSKITLIVGSAFVRSAEQVIRKDSRHDADERPDRAS